MTEHSIEPLAQLRIADECYKSIEALEAVLIRVREGCLNPDTLRQNMDKALRHIGRAEREVRPWRV